MESILPQGLTMRPATLDDIDMLYSLSHDYDVSQYGADGEEEYTREDIRIIFSGPDVNLERDTRLVFDREGRLVGSLFLEDHKHAKFFVTTRIHPGYSNPRLGDYLVGLGEAWARERMAQAEPGVRVTIGCWMPTTDSAAIARYERAGFQEVRRHWRMEIELNEEPAAPVWPDGVELRPLCLSATITRCTGRSKQPSRTIGAMSRTHSSNGSTGPSSDRTSIPRSGLSPGRASRWPEVHSV